MRPVKYETAEEMQRIIDLYFLACKNKQSETPEDPKDLSEEDLDVFNSVECVYPTVTGLALSLNMTREGLIHYENKDNPKFADTIKKAKCKIEAFLEGRLYSNNVTGCIFNLKNNYAWADKQEIDHKQRFVNKKDEDLHAIDKKILKDLGLI